MSTPHKIFPVAILPGDRSGRPLAVIQGDSAGRIASWGQEAQGILGWSASETVGKRVADLAAGSACRHAVNACIEGFIQKRGGAGTHRPLLIAARHKDGHQVLLEIRLESANQRGRGAFSATLQPVHGHSPDQKSTLEPSSPIFSLSRDAIIVSDVDGTVLFWNSGAESMFGHRAQVAIGAPLESLLSPDWAFSFPTVRRELLESGRWEGEFSGTRPDGTEITVLSRWEIEPGVEASSQRILISNTDVGAWKTRVEAARLVQQEQHGFDWLFGQNSDGVFAFDPRRGLVCANPALSTLTGYSNAELLMIEPEALVADEQLHLLRSSFREALRGKPQTAEFSCRTKDGGVLDASITLLPHIVDSKVAGLHGIVKDIGRRKRDERRILYLANHDALTGLPNRNLLQDRMQHAIEQARRLKQQLAVLFMDLNRFKVINDSLGHDKGDLLLQTVATRLKTAIRDVDTVARIGGDEFVVILENISAVDDVSQVAKTLLKVVSQPMDLDGNTITVSTSIGASIYPDDAQDAASLQKNADLAMYAAKEHGCGNFRLYAPHMSAKAADRLSWESSLRDAIERGHLVLHYQPRLDLISNTIAGVEALVRWDHPTNGLIYPATFISIAEETGMIDALGEWVLRAACRQMAAWRQEGLRPLKMSVNMSAIQLRSEHIMPTVTQALDDFNLEADCLEIELTESSLMQNLDTAFDTLQAFRARGISLAIDDFGTGYSSLNYLKRLPINTLKIDKSFIRDVCQNEDDAAIVSGTVAMAHSMRLRVVAEGVTSFDQIRFLEAHHCDEIQGYIFCQPLPAQEVESFFRTCELRGVHYSWTH